MWRLLLILFCLSAPMGAAGLRVVSYNIGAHLTNGGNPDGPYYFDYGLGDSSTLDHTAVRDVLLRIDADVVALQEIHLADISGDSDDLDDLAASLELPHVHVPLTSGDIDPSLVVVFLSRYPFLEVDSVVSPSGFKELTRNFPAVRVDVPETTADPLIVSAHLKSGTGSDDRFRRAVEMQRLSRYFETKGITDDDPYIVLGDFNPTGNSTTFFSLPSGLPGSLSLGPDIMIPINYSTDMRSYFTSVDPVLLDSRQLDGSDATFQSGSTLDLILVSPMIAAQVFASEVYNSDLDLSNSEGLPKSGLPLGSMVSLDASDHYAVFADLELVETPPYAFVAAGDSISEDFDSFSGFRSPLRWTSGDAVWQGADDGSSSLVGGRAYGVGQEVAAGFLLGGGDRMLEVEFANQSTSPLTMLDVSYQAEQWRAAMGGSADAIEVEFLAGGIMTLLDPLSFFARTDLPDGPAAIAESRNLRLRGLSVAPGDGFKLRFRFVQGPGSGGLPADVFVNEIHYDNAGADEGEFVEVVVGPGFTGELGDVSIQFYNGSNGMEDGGGHSLDTFELGETSSSGHRIFSKSISSIQNGSPDGFALIVNGVVARFLSYEGSFTAVEGFAAGMTSVDMEVSQSTTEPAGMNALGLVGTGGGEGDFVWQKIAAAHSPGASNSGQDFTLPGLPPQGLAIDDLVVAFVADSDGDGLADDEDADDDNDGQSDDFELAFGSDPFSADSKFVVNLAVGTGGSELRFPGAPGVIYTIEWCDDLESWDQSATVEGEGAEVLFPIPTTSGRQFVRVRAGL